MLKKFKFSIMIIFIFLVSFVLNAKTIDENELIKMSKLSNTQIIDLRTPKEALQTGIIKGATLHNYFDSTFNSFLNSLDKNNNYIIYCHSGGRSGNAEKRMKRLGFHVFNYSPGMTGWKSKKLPTVRYNK